MRLGFPTSVWANGRWQSVFCPFLRCLPRWGPASWFKIIGIFYLKRRVAMPLGLLSDLKTWDLTNDNYHFSSSSTGKDAERSGAILSNNPAVLTQPFFLYSPLYSVPWSVRAEARPQRPRLVLTLTSSTCFLQGFPLLFVLACWWADSNKAFATTHKDQTRCPCSHQYN